jgi:hypothetical protein
MDFIFAPVNPFSGCIFPSVGQYVRTVTWQAVAHAQRHQHITGISAYFYYMKVADIVYSQKLKYYGITVKLL